MRRELRSATGSNQALARQDHLHPSKVLADDGKAFAPFSATGEREPTGQHSFEQASIRPGLSAKSPTA